MKSYRRYKGNRPKSGGKRLLKILLALIILGALCFGALFGAVMAGNRDRMEGEPQVMVILGCQVMPWGPSILLQDRLNTALDYLADHPDTVVVVSGGQGADEHMSEAAAMAAYLTARGIPEEQILLEEESRNTWENLTCTAALLTELGYSVHGDMVVVSNGFHLTRVRMLWGRVFGDTEGLSTLAAPSSHVPSRLRMYIREPLALVKSFLFDRGV